MAPSVLAAPDGDVVLARPASAALGAGDLIVMASPDGRGVSAIDATGARRWHAKTGASGASPFTSSLVGAPGARVAVVTRERVLLLDARTGATRGQRQVGPVSDEDAPGCVFEQRGAACALACPATFELVSCASLAPIGPQWTLAGGASRPGALLGAAGDLLLASVPGPRSPTGTFFVPYVVVALDAATGRTVWSSEALGKLWPAAHLSGVASDGRSAWVGTLDGHLDAFDPRTGAVAWSTTQQAPRGSEPQAEFVPGAGADPASGLLVRDGENVRRRRLTDGHVTWTIHAPGERVVSRDLAGPIDITRSGAVRVVDPESGAALASFRLPASGLRRLLRVGDGWLVSSPMGLARFDTTGHLKASVDLVGANDHVVGDGAIAVRARERLTVVDRHSLLPIYELTDAIYTVVALEGALGRGVMAVIRHADRPFDKNDPDSFGELRIIRFRSVGGR